MFRLPTRPRVWPAVDVESLSGSRKGLASAAGHPDRAEQNPSCGYSPATFFLRRRHFLFPPWLAVDVEYLVMAGDELVSTASQLLSGQRSRTSQTKPFVPSEATMDLSREEMYELAWSAPMTEIA